MFFFWGIVMPRPGVLAKIAKVLGTTPEALAGEPGLASRKIDEREHPTTRSLSRAAALRKPQAQG